MSPINGANSSDLNSTNYHKPHTVADITDQNVKTIMHMEDTAKANRNVTVAALRSYGCISFGSAHG